ncbi:hypothetical protein [Streptomyces sp. NPDC005141]
MRVDFGTRRTEPDQRLERTPRAGGPTATRMTALRSPNSTADERC